MSAHDEETLNQAMAWTEEHRETYIKSGGTRGHIMDMRPLGGDLFVPSLLLRYVGRKSGKAMIAPLLYTYFGDEVVIVGSKGGAPKHPAWYLNLKAGGPVAFQIATQAYDATWREPGDHEKDEIWTHVLRQFPVFAQYRASTSREIPLVSLRAQEATSVFEE